VSLLALLILAGPSGDARSHWTFDPAHSYGGVVRQFGASLCSPAAALVLLPFHLLPFEAFRVLVMAAEMGALVHLVGPWAFALVALFAVLLELSTGNIQARLVLAVLLGSRYPAVWSVVLLTKVTPGNGLLWSTVRRKWRSLGIALAATAVVAPASP
jgi:hypothetical protein